MTRHLLSSLVFLWLAAAVVAAQVGQQSQSQAPERSPATSALRRAQMAGHYRAVTAIYEGVIRGDLAAVHQAALAIWGLAAPAGMPAVGDRIANFIQLEGRQAAQTENLQRAAEASAAMLTLCGDCHTAVNVRVGTPATTAPTVGGIVGHMLAHRNAVESLVEGLVAPSLSRWRAGAEGLVVAPLSSSDLPPDPELTLAVRQSEAAVHALGKEALAAADKTERTAVFGKIIATCANCHRLHSRIWGPRSYTP